MKILFIILIALNVVAILIQTLALILLLSLKEIIVKKNQKFLLVALCITELIYATADIVETSCTLQDVHNMITLLIVLQNGTTVNFFNIFIMVMITTDRFLEIYLNIKCNIYWSAEKTKVVLFVALLICFLSFIPLFTVLLRSRTVFGKLVTCYIFPTLSLIFLIVFSFSYY